MSWNLHTDKRKGKAYISLKKNRRVEKKIESDYIYLGLEGDAVKILFDLETKPLIDEKEISYSGELILGSIAKSIQFNKVVEKYTKDRRVANIITDIIILRTLFPESKNKLVKVRLPSSILKDTNELKYNKEVYDLMDILHNNMSDTMYDLIKNAVKIHHLDLKHLIIDATRIKIWKDEETDLIKFGYCSRNEIKSLPQENLILGVNNQYVPLFANIYPGNTPDVKMFGDFLNSINNQYKELSCNVKDKFMIFDQGNVKKVNIECLRELRKYGINFVSMYKTTGSSRFIKKVNRSDMSLIYSKEITKNVKTEIFGKVIEDRVYGKLARLLVCYNSDVMEQKCKTLDRKVEFIKKVVENKENINDIKMLITKYNLKQVIKINEMIEGLELIINKEKLEERKKYYGYFVLFTEHPGISAEEILEIYKSRDIVEEGFRALKSDLEIDPVYHSKDERIETHTVMVVLGYLLLSLLRAILDKAGIHYSFAMLKEIIKSGNAVEGFFDHEKLENRLQIWRPIKLGVELEEIFKVVMIKIPTFDVKKVIPTKLS
jgi:transposase